MGMMEPSPEMITMFMQRLRCDAEAAENTIRELTKLMPSSQSGALPCLDGPQWIQGWQARTKFGPASDDFLDHYSALADDTSTSGKKREAAMLFSAAEGHINDDEPDAALKSGQEALALYRKLNDTVALADTSRLVIHAYCLKADNARWSGDNDAAEAALGEADKLARDELANFQGKNPRAEAAMLLSLSELGIKANLADEQSLEFAQKASTLFHEAGDKKMDAIAMLVSTQIHCKKHKCKKMVEVANRAVQLFQGVSDKKGEAKALHMLAIAHASNHNLDEALHCAQDALKLVQEMDIKHLVALEMISVANLYLEQNKPKIALQHAQDALAMSKKIKKGKAWEAAAEQAVVEGYIGMMEMGKAVEVATKGVERCQESGDKREEVYAQMTLAHTLLAKNDPEEAVTVGEMAVDLCQEIGDENWEAMASVMLAEMHREVGDFDAAQKAIQMAVEVFQKRHDTHHEAVASAMLSRVFLESGEIEDGVEAAEKGRAIFHDNEEKDHEEIALLTLSNAYSEKGKLAEALAAANESLQIAKVMGHKEGEACALAMVSKVHQKTEDFSKALDVAKDVRKIWHKLCHSGAEADALHQIARIHLSKFESRQCLRAAEAAEKLCRKNGYAGILVNVLLTSIEAHVQALSFGGASNDVKAKAMNTVTEAVAIADSTQLPNLRASTQFWNSQVLLLNNRPQDAVGAASTSRILYRQIRDAVNEGQALLMVARAYMKIDGSKEFAIRAADDALETFDACGNADGAESAKEILYNLGALGMRNLPPGMVPIAAGAATEQVQEMQAVSVAGAKPKGLDREMVSQTVQEMAKAAIGLDDAVYLDSPLMDSGMDSLTAVSFRNGLQQNLGVKLPSSLMFDYPTMKEVANRIVELSLEE